MIGLLFGIVLSILLYISIIHSFMELEDAVITFKYRSIRGFGDGFAFIIDDTIINGGALNGKGRL